MQTALILAALLVVSGCGFGETRLDGPTPLGGTWAVVAAPGIEIIDGAEAPRVQFTVGARLQGETGCTDFSAPVRVTGNQLEIGPLELAEPQQPCSLRRTAIQAAFLGALHQVTSFSGGRPGERLTFNGAGGEIVLVSPESLPDP